MKYLLKFRKIYEKDKEDILSWRNHPVSRKNSFNNKLISSKEHSKWFAKIKKKENYNYIALLNNKKIGFINYQNIKPNKFLVSINLKPNLRNKGYGSKILSNTSNLIISSSLNTKIYAKIKNSNLQSIKAFEKANYRKYRKYSNYTLFRYYLTQKKMKKKKKSENPQTIINKIEKIRSKNNSNWMDILRIAFKYSPKEAAKVMSEIYSHDKKISSLAEKLKKID